jgi:parvulin-like peptidyl-prolyl isomerase
MDSHVRRRLRQVPFASGVSRFRKPAVNVCLAMLLLSSAGCNSQKARLTNEEIQRYRLAHKPERPDELLVSGEKVTLEDVLGPSLDVDASSPSLKEELLRRAREVPLSQFKREARGVLERRLGNNIVNIILYKRGLREVKGKLDEQQQEKAMEKEMIRFTMEHGGNAAAADAALQEMGLSRERFKQYAMKQALIQHYVATKFPYSRLITHRDLLECYEQMKADNFFQPGVIQFRLIDIQITKVPLSGAQDDPLQVARSLADEVMKKIEAGEDFAELARKYSTDPRRATGGLWPECDPEALAEPYDVLGKKAGDMRPGEVAGPIDVIDHIFIMKLEKKQEKGYRPLVEVQDVVEARILANRRRAAMEQLNAEFEQVSALGDTDRFIDRCLESLYRQARVQGP